MIDKRDQELMTLKGWVDRYWEMLPDYETMEKTYDAIERQYFRAFGCNKYSDFDSFRNCFYRYSQKETK